MPPLVIKPKVSPEPGVGISYAVSMSAIAAQIRYEWYQTINSSPKIRNPMTVCVSELLTVTGSVD